MTDNRKLPDATGDIKSLQREEIFKSPWFIGGLIVAFFLCVVVLVGGSYFLPKIIPTSAPTSVAVKGPTETFTVEPTVGAAPGLKETRTEPPTKVERTEAVAINPTGTPTVGLVETIPVPTDTPAVTVEPAPHPTEKLSTPPPIDPATLPGKIAAPAFIFNKDLKAGTYYLYIASAPDWQPKLFQKAASQPTFSPDGTEIIFRSWGGPEGSYSEQLVLRALDGSHDRLITNHIEDARPHWASCEQMFIVFHSRPAGYNTRVYLQGTWVGALDDPNGRKELAAGESPTWLPDGRIVYASGYPESGLYVMNKGGSDSQLIWSSSGLVAPKGAPHSNQVVFSYKDDLYLLDITGGSSGPRPLLETSERERLPAWSPDGPFMAYVTDRDGNWAVYAMRADGTGRVKLFDLPGSIDGKPDNVPPDRAFGWYEEQLAWGR
jgi:hypothetical protein